MHPMVRQNLPNAKIAESLAIATAEILLGVVGDVRADHLTGIFSHKAEVGLITRPGWAQRRFPILSGLLRLMGKGRAEKLSDAP